MRQDTLRGVFLLDLVYILVIAGLVIWRVSALISARRARSAGSRLHLRLTGVFAAMALAPTILVAVFATLTVSFGIEGWFSDQIGSVVRNSLATAESYEMEHRRRIRTEAVAMATDINGESPRIVNDGQLGDYLRAQAAIRQVPEAYIFDGDMNLRARGEYSYLFNFTPPSEEAIARARAGDVVVISDSEASEVRALVHLDGFVDYFLYLARPVDGDVLRLLDDTQETVQLYERLERDRDSILMEFAILYVGFALVVILAATWAGLWFAERLARPIGRLAGAARPGGGGRPRRARAGGAGGRRDRGPRPRVQPHDRAGEGPARRAGGREPRDGAAPALHGDGAVGRHGRGRAARRRGPGGAAERGGRQDAGLHARRGRGPAARRRGPPVRPAAGAGPRAGQRPRLGAGARAGEGRGAGFPRPRGAHRGGRRRGGLRADLRRPDRAGDRPAAGRLGRHRAAHRA